MARRRYISTEISLDGRVNKLAQKGGDFAVLFYTWMIPHAEDDGSIVGDEAELMLRIIPGRHEKKPADITAALKCMVKLGLIGWDQAANKITFPPSFWKHQSYISERRRNRAAERRTTPHNAASERTSPHNAVKDEAEGEGGGVKLKVKFKSSSEADDEEILPIIFTLYEQVIGPLTQPMSQKLEEAENEYSQECIRHSFDEADRQNKRSWAYVEAILKAHKREGCYAKSGPRDARKGAKSTVASSGPDLGPWKRFAAGED